MWSYTMIHVVMEPCKFTTVVSIQPKPIQRLHQENHLVLNLYSLFSYPLPLFLSSFIFSFELSFLLVSVFETGYCCVDKSGLKHARLSRIVLKSCETH